MNAYTSLAPLYDRLIDQRIYQKFANRMCALLERAGIREGLLLELCCGTGSLSRLLARRGYEMIGCDASAEMLTVAREKSAGLPVPPVWICQRAHQLDLYGTVRGVVCCLDSVNYLTGLRELKRAFARVSLFLEPGGLFLFDVKSRQLFEQLAGTSSVQEEEDFLCLWQYDFDPVSGRGEHQVDIFVENGAGYRRFTEIHSQRWYSLETLKQALEQAGLTLTGVYQDYTPRRAKEETGRLLLAAKKKG